MSHAISRGKEIDSLFSHNRAESFFEYSIPTSITHNMDNVFDKGRYEGEDITFSPKLREKFMEPVFVGGKCDYSLEQMRDSLFFPRDSSPIHLLSCNYSNNNNNNPMIVDQLSSRNDKNGVSGNNNHIGSYLPSSEQEPFTTANASDNSGCVSPVQSERSTPTDLVNIQRFNQHLPLNDGQMVGKRVLGRNTTESVNTNGACNFANGFSSNSIMKLNNEPDVGKYDKVSTADEDSLLVQVGDGLPVHNVVHGRSNNRTRCSMVSKKAGKSDKQMKFMNKSRDIGAKRGKGYSSSAYSFIHHQLEVKGCEIPNFIKTILTVSTSNPKFVTAQESFVFGWISKNHEDIFAAIPSEMLPAQYRELQKTVKGKIENDSKICHGV